MTGRTTDGPIRTPGPDHPITITPHPLRVIVSAGLRVIADTMEALELREASYPPVLYIPRKDMARLERSTYATRCPYKGEAAYYSWGEGETGRNAAWTYEAPHEAVAAIAGHLAFYPDKVAIGRRAA